MSFENESHFVSNIFKLISGLILKGEFREFEGGENLLPPRKSLGRMLQWPRDDSNWPNGNISVMIETEILQLHDKYKFSSTFHIHVLKLVDQVTSSPVDWSAMYEKFFHANL